jgi:release factor glutamine methyltransferase
MHIAQALQAAAALGIERLDAQILLLHALQRSEHDRAWLLAHDTDALAPETQTRFETALQRRRRGEPVAYILGYKEFYGLRLAVDSRVLVPRPDTETLVDWALELIPKDQPWRVLDLGTGSGAIALAIAQHRPMAQVNATDASALALQVAQANAQALQLPLRLLHNPTPASWFAPVQGERFDLIVSNPPYIAEGDAHLQALAHEPRMALTSGADGLDDIRKIANAAEQHLVPGAWLLLEHGFDQALGVDHILRDAGFVQTESRKDLAGHIRVSGGTVTV